MGRTVAAAVAAVPLLGAPASASAAADVSTTITPNPTSIRLGGQTGVALSATNSGPDAAANVQTTLPVPNPPWSFQGFISITQGAASYNGGTSTVTANFGTINAGGTATVSLQLRGERSGQAELQVSSTTTTSESSGANNAASVTVPITALEISPASIALGDVETGRISSSQAVTLTNRASIPIQMTNFQKSGPDSADFVVAEDACSGQTLAVDASCNLGFRFAPGAEAPRAATVAANSSTAGVTPVSFELTGTGVAPPPTPLELTPVFNRVVGTAGKKVVVRYVSSISADVVLKVFKAGGKNRASKGAAAPKPIATLTGVAVTGLNTIRWNGRKGTGRKPAPPGRYTLELAATGADQTDEVTMRLRLREP